MKLRLEVEIDTDNAADLKKMNDLKSAMEEIEKLLTQAIEKQEENSE